MAGILFCIAVLIVAPLTVWHYAGYFDGRYDHDDV